MSSIEDLVSAIHTASIPKNHTVLIYGDPKSGKTRLAATIAKLGACKKINLFDIENGSDTILEMAKKGSLTPEEAAKFNIIKITDTPDEPYAYETVPKLFTSDNRGKGWDICTLHGRVRENCAICAKDTTARWSHFNIKECGHDTWNILDSGSQLADSALAFAMRNADYSVKAGWDEYGLQGRVSTDVLSTIQAAKTNWICITHQLVHETDDPQNKNIKPDSRPEKFYPLWGTKAFSLKVAKFFGTVIYTNMRLKTHAGGSSTGYNSFTITGSRLGLELEKETELSLAKVFEKTDLFKK